MKRNLARVSNPSWTESSNFALAAKLCERWNSGKLYEIFWEYADLNESVLSNRKARFWLCYEQGELSGFALGRIVREIFVIEELWGKSDGLFGDTIRITEEDLTRARVFRSQVLNGIQERPLLVRGAIDNYFAHGIARALRLPWFNGLVLAERSVRKGINRVTLPDGYFLRHYVSGDEVFFSSLYRRVYSEVVTPTEFRDWVTGSIGKTIVASYGKERVGFIITEKRSYSSMGDFAIAVSPEHQRRGVGGALLDAGIDIMYQLGVKRIIVDYRTLNGATHALYGSRGFRPRRTYNYFWVD